MRRWISLMMAVLVVTLVSFSSFSSFSLPISLVGVNTVYAQEGTPPTDTGNVTENDPGLTAFTSYPVQEVAVGDNVTFDVKLRAATPQTVHLSVEDLPEGWTAVFKGGTKVIRAVYVDPGDDASVQLRIEVPDEVESGSYPFSVVVRGEDEQAKLPIELIVAERVPPSLSLDVELPTLRGTANTTFRYDANLKNEGDEDLTVNLIANAPAGFQVVFKLSGKEVTSVPLAADESKRLSIEIKAYEDVPAGTYAVDVVAQGGEAQAAVTLNAEVTGQPDLSLTAPDGRLSGEAYAGEETTFQLMVRNTGSAPARDITLSASQPSGWSVEFDPSEITEVQAGQQVEVTAKVKPPSQAVAGDYMVTLRARPEEGSTESVEFRVTVRTSTVWGIVGVALIAVAIAVVMAAVMRFGRR